MNSLFFMTIAKLYPNIAMGHGLVTVSSFDPVYRIVHMEQVSTEFPHVNWFIDWQELKEDNSIKSWSL